MISSQSFGMEAAVDDVVARRRLHPAVGRQNPEGRGERPERDHQRGEKMRPARHQLAAEQQHAEEGRLEKERRQALVGEQRRDDVADVVGEAAPVRAELERHDDAGHDAHAERDGEDLDPEGRNAEIDLALGGEMQALQNRDEGGEPDCEGRQEKVPADHPGELEAR